MPILAVKKNVKQANENEFSNLKKSEFRTDLKRQTFCDLQVFSSKMATIPI